jgi:hypothetical protein
MLHPQADLLKTEIPLIHFGIHMDLSLASCQKHYLCYKKNAYVEFAHKNLVKTNQIRRTNGDLT